MTFHSVGNVIIPTDELHHFSEGQAYHQPGTVDLVIPPLRSFGPRLWDGG